MKERVTQMSTTTRLTLEEFLVQPDTEPGSEFVDGVAIQKPMPNFVSTLIQRLFIEVIGPYIRLHALGFYGCEGRCVFGPPGGEKAFLPDFLFVTRERLAGIDPRRPFRAAPDLAAEVLSPDDQIGDVQAKLAFYLRYGVRLAWLIDPDRRTLTVMAVGAAPRLLDEDALLDGGDVLPGFSCLVRDLLPQTGDAWIEQV